MTGKNRKSIYFFLASLVIHFVVTGLFLLRSNSYKTKTETLPLDIVINPSQSKPAPKFQSAHHSAKEKTSANTFSSATASSKKAQQILSEGFKISMKNAGTAVPQGQTIFGEAPAPFQGNGAWVEKVDFKQGVELTTFFKRLLGKIDGALDYPEDMAKERLEGDVRVDLFVNRKGQLVGDFHSVKGSQPLLNLYVMSSLLVLLKDPLPENLWSKDEGNIALSIHVEFKTFQFSEMRIRNSADFNSNELTLTRARYVVPLAVEKTEKFFTRYMPPIIPIPGGFYVDLVMLTKYINNIGTPDPDDQRSQRLSLTREQLELATKKKETSL